MRAADIIRSVCDRTGIVRREIMGRDSTPRVVRARHMSQWLIRHRLGWSYLRIAHLFGRKNHTSVLYAVRKIDRLRTECDDIREITDEAVS